MCGRRILGLIMDRCSQLLRKWSRVEEDASPGLVVSPKKPRAGLYWEAVRGIVQRGEVEEELDRIGASRYEMEGGRGIIGASAAMSWRPLDHTYEVIAYRERSRWGKPREVSDRSVKEMDRKFPSTFNNYDEEAGRRAISPHTPCPVMFGIRGDILADLPPAMGTIESERIDRWILFLSNQGTDDHVMGRWRELLPARTYSIKGRIVSTPRTIAGGHTLITMLPDRSRQELDLAAYEPSKVVPGGGAQAEAWGCRSGRGRAAGGAPNAQSGKDRGAGAGEHEGQDGQPHLFQVQARACSPWGGTEVTGAGYAAANNRNRRRPRRARCANWSRDGMSLR